MAKGDILKEAGLIIEEFTVKANEDIEKGEIVWNDGNGVLAASAGDKGPFFMALEAHDYSEESTHKVKCVVAGFVEAQKKANGATKKGQYMEVSATDGELTIWDYTTPGAWFDVAGICSEDAGASDTTAKILLGHGGK